MKEIIKSMQKGMKRFNIYLETLIKEITQEKELQRIRMEKEEVIVSLLSNDMILYIEDAKIQPKTHKINNRIQ